ncbi:hypothetical protein GCM10025781_26850 [Kocuria gwangalliensis]|uniref:Uncharacterized protein n=1 Tax=Kocuria gwangalliensis TaxID=501592 RepID=A0ABP8XEN0_9MICC
MHMWARGNVSQSWVQIPLDSLRLTARGGCRDADRDLDMSYGALNAAGSPHRDHVLEGICQCGPSAL